MSLANSSFSVKADGSTSKNARIKGGALDDYQHGAELHQLQCLLEHS